MTEERVTEAYELWIAGEQYTQIADRMGISPITVGQYIKEAKKSAADLGAGLRWLSDRRGTIDFGPAELPDGNAGCVVSVYRPDGSRVASFPTWPSYRTNASFVSYAIAESIAAMQRLEDAA